MANCSHATNSRQVHARLREASSLQDKKRQGVPYLILFNQCRYVCSVFPTFYQHISPLLRNREPKSLTFLLRPDWRDGAFPGFSLVVASITLQILRTFT